MIDNKKTEFISYPSDWDSARIGRKDNPIIITMRNGLTIQQYSENGDYKITRIETIGDGKINEKRVKYVSNITKDIYEKYLVRKGDILFSHINSDPHIGKTAIADHDYSNLLHGMNLLLIRTNPEIITPIFLHFIFRYFRQIGVFIRICSRAVNQSSINQEKLRAIEIPLPSLPEQNRIAFFLKAIQTAIEQQERMIALTQELKTAMMHKLFTEGLHGEPQKQTEIGLIPESWEATRIGSIGKCLTGATPQTAVPEYYSPKEYDFISPADLGKTRYVYNSDRKISKSGIEVVRAIPKESILCVCIGSSIGKVGMSYKDLSATNQQINTILINQSFLPPFIYYLLSYYSNYWKGFSTFGTIPILNKGRFEGIPIYVPTRYSDQVIISETLISIDEKIEIYGKKKLLLMELFITLLSKLMTGQIRVNEVEIPEFE